MAYLQGSLDFRHLLLFPCFVEESVMFSMYSISLSLSVKSITVLYTGFVFTVFGISGITVGFVSVRFCILNLFRIYVFMRGRRWSSQNGVKLCRLRLLCAMLPRSICEADMFNTVLTDFYVVRIDETVADTV